MATIWLTYAWADNTQGDVDFVAQELINVGLRVKLDRWTIEAGKRLWEQIGNFIQNPTECDAWVLYATPNSLGSEACKEEFAYALDQALQARGDTFPVIGLFPSPVDKALIPPGIRTRLYVSTNDPDWKERIKAAAEKRSPDIEHPSILPYALQVHDPKPGSQRYVIEVRPRAGTWAPFVAAVPISEKDKLDPHLSFGPKGGAPRQSIIRNLCPTSFPAMMENGGCW